MIRVFGWMRAVIATGLVMIPSAPQAANDTLENDLTGFWRFQQCSTYDSSKSARSGKIPDGVKCEKGRIGDAIRLRGTKHTDYFEADNLPPVILTKSFSINLWFRIEAHTSMDPNHNDTEYGTQVLSHKQLFLNIWLYSLYSYSSLITGAIHFMTTLNSCESVKTQVMTFQYQFMDSL